MFQTKVVTLDEIRILSYVQIYRTMSLFLKKIDEARSQFHVKYVFLTEIKFYVQSDVSLTKHVFSCLFCVQRTHKIGKT